MRLVISSSATSFDRRSGGVASCARETVLPPPPEFCAAAERNSGLAPRYVRRPFAGAPFPLPVLPSAACAQPPVATGLAGVSGGPATLTCTDPSDYAFAGDAYGYADSGLASSDGSLPTWTSLFCRLRGDSLLSCRLRGDIPREINRIDALTPALRGRACRHLVVPDGGISDVQG